MDQVRKIAVLRANSVGDFLFCLPALESLRVAYPEAEIVYLGLPWHKEFLAGRPSPIDRVVTVPVGLGVRTEAGQKVDEAELLAFFKEMQQEHFDLALQLHGGGKHSNPFVKRLGARLTAGFQTSDAEPLDISLPYNNFQNEVIRYVELVQKLGAPLVTLEPRLAVTAADLAEARRALGALRPPFIVLHVGANDPRRRWPAEKFAAVGDHFARAGWPVVLVGGQDEVQLAAATASRMTLPVENLAGKVSLNGLVGLLSQAALMIADDSGPLHLADALGKRTVGLYWVGNLFNFGPVYRARHIPLVSWRTTCPVCGRPCVMGNLPDENIERCPHNPTFISDIPVREVIISAERLLSMALPAEEAHDGEITA